MATGVGGRKLTLEAIGVEIEACWAPGREATRLAERLTDEGDRKAQRLMEEVVEAGWYTWDEVLSAASSPEHPRALHSG